MKSKRIECPIGIDCLLAAAQRGKPCPSRSDCKRLAKPWNLPYTIETWADGTKCLVVEVGATVFTGIEHLEKQEAGYRDALRLPYNYICISGLENPVLMVERYMSVEGWHSGEELMPNYFRWIAARKGANYTDFVDNYMDFSEDIYSSHYPYQEAMEYRTRYLSVPNYPHCVLPPNY